MARPTLIWDGLFAHRRRPIILGLSVESRSRAGARRLLAPKLWAKAREYHSRGDAYVLRSLTARPPASAPPREAAP